jgi:hypothetical protein
VDRRRNFVFSSFGLFYLGAFQCVIGVERRTFDHMCDGRVRTCRGRRYIQYSMWFPRIFPGTGGLVVAKRVAFDQIINTGPSAR